MESIERDRSVSLPVSSRRIPVFPSIKPTQGEWWFPVASVSCPATRPGWNSGRDRGKPITYSDGIVPIPVSLRAKPPPSRYRGTIARRRSNKILMAGRKWAFCRTDRLGSFMNPFLGRNQEINERLQIRRRTLGNAALKGLIARITWIARARGDMVHLNRTELSRVTEIRSRFEPSDIADWERSLIDASFVLFLFLLS